MSNPGEEFQRLVAADWQNPDTGNGVKIDLGHVVIAPTLDGGAADIMAPLKLPRRFSVVADANTIDILGRRVTRELRGLGHIELYVAPDDFRVDEKAIAMLREHTNNAETLVGVGSGKLASVVRRLAHIDKRPFALFPTAQSGPWASASHIAQWQKSGLLLAEPAATAGGVFVDLEINHAAPITLTQSGLGSFAAWMQGAEERALLAALGQEKPAATLKPLVQGELQSLLARAPKQFGLETTATLARLLLLQGLSSSLDAEPVLACDLMARWLLCFGGPLSPDAHSGALAGLAAQALSAAMADLRSRSDPPLVAPWLPPPEAFEAHYAIGPDVALHALSVEKNLDPEQAAKLSRALEKAWPHFTQGGGESTECADARALLHYLIQSPAPDTEALGLSRTIWANCVHHAREMASAPGLLDCMANVPGFSDTLIAGGRFQG